MEASGPAQRARPWLLPYNRRLRHLQGISLRNLVLVDKPRARPAQALDDEALPFSYVSPSKTLANEDQHRLEHSRSSSNLQAFNEFQAIDEPPRKGERRPEHASPFTPDRKRPSAGKLRRRSTLDWMNASPRVRQQKLEDMADNRMADVFFSLHIRGVAEPVYISEVVPKTMNPTFRFFDLQTCGPYATRQPELTVRVWVKSKKDGEYSFLLESSFSLKDLQYVGKSLQTSHQPLPANCVVLHLTDGVYAHIDDLATDPTYEPVPSANPLAGRVLSTATYDALMRLSTLDDCIQDALQTRAQLEHQIDSILIEHRKSTRMIRQVAVLRESWLNAENSIAVQKKQVQVAKSMRDELQRRLQKRRDFIATSQRLELDASVSMREDSAALPGIRASLANLNDELDGQKRRICEDLVKIFPIDPVPNRALYFTIRGVYLPNSNFEGERDLDEESVAAALGWVAQIVHQLSFYLSTPLPYPITARCSSSTISDPVSTTPGSAATVPLSVARIYPLFMKSVPRFRFEYAVFLLNKNIEILSNALGLRVIDLRQTLPNLKYLLYIATAGKGELPARRSGGIRGLIHGGRLRPTSLLSRSGSVDSSGTTSGFPGDEVSKGIALPNGAKFVSVSSINGSQKLRDL